MPVLFAIWNVATWEGPWPPTGSAPGKCTVLCDLLSTVMCTTYILKMA